MTFTVEPRSEHHRRGMAPPRNHRPPTNTASGPTGRIVAFPHPISSQAQRQTVSLHEQGCVLLSTALADAVFAPLLDPRSGRDLADWI